MSSSQANARASFSSSRPSGPREDLQYLIAMGKEQIRVEKGIGFAPLSDDPDQESQTSEMGKLLEQNQHLKRELGPRVIEIDDQIHALQVEFKAKYGKLLMDYQGLRGEFQARGQQIQEMDRELAQAKKNNGEYEWRVAILESQRNLCL